MIVLKAMGAAINKTVTVTEILRHRVMGLHQMGAAMLAMDLLEP